MRLKPPSGLRGLDLKPHPPEYITGFLLALWSHFFFSESNFESLTTVRESQEMLSLREGTGWDRCQKDGASVG